MIQSALVFLLGFLSAAFVVLLAAPLFWRQAHVLWHKQIAARLPLSLTALEADRDLLRASHAVSLRKAEMQTSRMRDKHTQAQLKIAADRAELEKLPQLLQDIEALHILQHNDRQQLATAQHALTILQAKQQSADEQLGYLQRQNEALSNLSDTLRLEIAGRELETDRLRREANDLRQEKKQLNNAKSELASQVAALKTSLESEKNRNQALEEKLHRLISELSDTQEKLERQNKDIQRKHDLSEGEKQTLSAQDQKLRDTISELAAEMVARTAAKEGENSPIHALLKDSSEPNKPVTTARKTKSKSLAGRIKNLTA